MLFIHSKKYKNNNKKENKLNHRYAVNVNNKNCFMDFVCKELKNNANIEENKINSFI